jgi:hypothetical protein
MKSTLFADHPDDDSSDFHLVRAWIERWSDSVTVVDYSTGGWEHLWNVDAPLAALKELPKRFFCQSAWADYPCVVGGDYHPAWESHPDDATGRDC